MSCRPPAITLRRLSHVCWSDLLHGDEMKRGSAAASGAYLTAGRPLSRTVDAEEPCHTLVVT